MFGKTSEHHEIEKFKKKIFACMLVLEAVIILTFVEGLMGVWIPFAVALPFYIGGTILIHKAYRRYIKYICPTCGAEFSLSKKNPLFALWAVMDFIFTAPPIELNAACLKCGYEGDCGVVYAESAKD